ncbi:Mo-dependent nitrogenase C-terminal domain-containing protein [Synechocystis sp. PCC 7509]|uniref:Mo-dependent nitrogenase C-terminal domain-containing protein n=1 Tax=Synechocystis sp. PCC 7509 TaxID=927677 RepID=UPI0002ABCF07|nr:Mo-dependent nitrogenase C-terminal domain-containing protein [Synechocystis sp. PCC 7509]
MTPCTDEQVSAWLRGLLTIAWADGNFDLEEQKLIAALVTNGGENTSPLTEIEPITSAELAAALKSSDSATAENFLRTAVMVAIADGVYSIDEDNLLHEFCQALGLSETALDSLRSTLYDQEKGMIPNFYLFTQLDNHALRPIRNWLDDLKIHDPKVARFLCKMIPAQCPFERDVKLFGRKIVHIPPMCKINPVYEQLVGLRFRALSYLADECHEDVSNYC